MSPAPDGTVSRRELLSGCEQQLRSAGIDAAASEARVLVAEAVGVATGELTLSLGEPVTEGAVARLDAMARRRAAGEPLQYVVGSWGFRSLDLMVDRRVLIPRPETEQVVEAALVELDRVGGRERSTVVVDLGTGSGAIGLSIAVERVRTEVWLTDRSEEALDVARANLAWIGRSGARVRIRRGEWFAALPAELRGRVDLVVSNPPYVRDDEPLPDEVARWEPVAALRSGPVGTEALDAVLSGAGEWLGERGAVVCELSPEQAVGVAATAMEHFEAVDTASDLAGRTRAIVARSPLRRTVR